MTAITIPSSVKVFAPEGLPNNLVELHLKGDIPPVFDGGFSVVPKPTIYVPAESISLYKTALPTMASYIVAEPNS